MFLDCEHDWHDWNLITSLAYNELIDLGVTSFPADPLKLKFKNALIISCQRYADLLGVPASKFTLNHEFDDAYYAGNLRRNLNLILYNEKKLTARLHHTLWHEIGHIRCGHTKHGDYEEIEANFFAGQAHAPNAIIREVRNRGYVIDQALLTNYFGLSKQSADKKLVYFNNYPNAHPNDLDELLIAHFSPFINNFFPGRNKFAIDDYFTNLEDARSAW